MISTALSPRFSPLIRIAGPQDLDALVSLEEACFSVPWSRKSFEAELTGNPFSRLFVVPHPNGDECSFPLIAYLSCWLVFDELRFLNLAVDEAFRRQGLARTLIAQAIRQGLENGCQRGLLEVRASNHVARRLYQSFQFKEYARRKSYYTNPDEDAILMALESLPSLPL
ncbi:MAG: ribosomal protein S18-alanine N-acetyltransferase [Nitrospirales bacterium]|nr:ribosomal protein S18-alanine N-acetyltransferase [Nitrospirales bacterium]